MKLKIHSSVDLITNSSTIIFTYSDGSLSALKELVNEMLSIFGRSETFDDIFYADIFLEEFYPYYDKLNEEGLVYDNNYVEHTMEEVLKGMPKPEWMLSAENRDDNYDNYPYSTTIQICSKSEKYEELAKKLINYLYSTDHEATYD